MNITYIKNIATRKGFKSKLKNPTTDELLKWMKEMGVEVKIKETQAFGPNSMVQGFTPYTDKWVDNTCYTDYNEALMNGMKMGLKSIPDID